MNYFPMFMDIEDREILICGGGKHAADKIEKLRPFHPKFRVISENISEEIKNERDIAVEERRFSAEDLYAYPVFVIAAENGEENERIARLCNERHIPVNAVDQSKDCDFIFSSMIVTERLCIGISTGGVSPTGAVCLRNAVSEIIPDDIDEILLWIRSLKENLKNRQTENSALKRILRLAVNEAFLRGRILSEEELEKILVEEKA